MTDMVLTKGVTLNVEPELRIPQLLATMEPDARRSTIRQIIQRSASLGDRCKMIDGEMLYEIRTNEYWRDWGFPDFESYCSHELGYTRRTVDYRIAVYVKFVLEVGASEEILNALEWSKAKELISVVTKENFAEVVEAATTMSVSEVVAFVREKRAQQKAELEALDNLDSPDKPPVEQKPEFKTIKFDLPEEEYATVLHALDLVQSDEQVRNRAAQLVAICHVYISESLKSSMEKLKNLQMGISALEKAFNVRLEVILNRPEDFGLSPEDLEAASN